MNSIRETEKSINSSRKSIEEKLDPIIRELFATEDFHKITVRTIAKRARVGYGAIYDRFGNKEKLLFTFIDRWMSDLCDRIIDHLKGLDDIKERLRKVFWVNLDYYERNPNVGIILYMTVPLKTWMSDETYSMKKMTKIFLGVLREGQERGYLKTNLPARVLMDLMWGQVNRSFVMWIYRGKIESLADQSDPLFEVLWDAIRVN